MSDTNHLRLAAVRWRRARRAFFAKAATGAIWPETKDELAELASAEGALDTAAQIIAEEMGE